MKRLTAVAVLVLLVVTTPELLGQGRGGGGSGGGGGGGSQALIEPTPFEEFVSKLKLDSKKQLPDVEKLFTAAATQAAPIVQDMVRIRTSMVAADGKPDELAPLHTAYTAAATKMAALELGAFRQVQALLNPGQLSKSADAFQWMAGLFQPPTPRAPRAPRGGGGVK